MNIEKSRVDNAKIQNEIMEKVKKYSFKSLSDSELLTLLFNCNCKKDDLTTISQKILDFENGGWHNLNSLSNKTMLDISGLSLINIFRIKACSEIAFRMIQAKRKKSISLKSPESVALFFMEILRYETKEHVITAFFDTKAKFISYKTIHVGTVDSAPVSPSAVLREAILCNAAYMILLHNHPSGDAAPSGPDRDITSRLYKCCNIMGVSLKDHIIIGDNAYFSFLEHNLINA